MSPIVAILLFLHVLGAIVAFGPTFTFSLIASLSRQYPQHGPFGIQLSALISKRLVLPMAVVQGLTGLGLVIAVPYDILAIHWLTLGIVLYLIDLAFAFWVQLPAVERMVAITKPALAGGGPSPAAGLQPVALCQDRRRVHRPSSPRWACVCATVASSWPRCWSRSSS